MYVAAQMRDAGENEADDGKRFASDLSKSTAIKKTAPGFTHLDPAQFHEYFAADLSAEQAGFSSSRARLNSPAFSIDCSPCQGTAGRSNRALSPDGQSN